MMTDVDERSLALRQEFAALLSRFLNGDAGVDDLLVFEAPLAFDRSIDADLRRDLNRIALLAEEVERDWRPIEDLHAQAFDLRSVAPAFARQPAAASVRTEVKPPTATIPQSIWQTESASLNSEAPAITLMATTPS